jgi:NagD protein
VHEAFDAYVFDMDGTIYLGEDLLPGAEELLALIPAAGRRRVFLTNNPTRTRAHYAAKLTGLGVPVLADEIVTSATITAAWLVANRPGKACFVLGEAALFEALAEAGVPCTTDPAEVEVVLTSFDRTFSYDKLQIAFDACWQRPEVELIATHPDAYCPVPGGGEPDAAAMTAAVEAATGRRVTHTLGKPSAEALHTALGLIGVPVDRAIMVGDRLYTDIAMGCAAGAATALVLTGDSTLAEAEAAGPGATPHYILDDVGALIPALRQVNQEEGPR